jgi:hypothetical protein
MSPARPSKIGPEVCGRGRHPRKYASCGNSIGSFVKNDASLLTLYATWDNFVDFRKFYTSLFRNLSMDWLEESHPEYRSAVGFPSWFLGMYAVKALTDNLQE